MKNKADLLFKFLLKRPTIIIIIGEEKKESEQRINQLLDIYFKTKKNILVFTADNKNINNLKFFLKYSKQLIFVVTSMRILQKNILETISSLPEKTNLVINLDSPIIERLEKIIGIKTLSFGFSEKSNFRIISDDTKLKISYKGNIIPTWLRSKSSKDIYAVLSSLVIGSILGLNLVEISQIFKKNNISL